MDKLKQYVVFTVLGCLVVLAAGWFLLVSPKRSDAAALRTQSASQVSSNAQLENQLQVLKAQAKDLPKQQAKLAAVAAKIPDNPALPAMIRALTGASTAAGVELVSVTPSTPVAVAAAAPTATVQAGGTKSAGATAVAPNAAGVLTSIPVALNVVGGYFQVEQFVASLENLPRSMRVSNINMVPGLNPLKANPTSANVADGRSLTTTITGQVFMAANRPTATAVTVPGQAVAGTATGPVAPVTPAKK
jgi:type IV pilus assembly protein PilO